MTDKYKEFQDYLKPIHGNLIQKTPAIVKEKLSYVPQKVEFGFNGKIVSTATAFFYKYEDKTYLITNWHNVTGRHHKTFSVLSPTACIPNEIHFKIPYWHLIKKDPQGDFGVIRYKDLKISLYKDADNLEPIWYVHPAFENSVDVIAFEIPHQEIKDSSIRYINDSFLDFNNFDAHPGYDVFVLGYPNGISGGGHLPIWKRGSLATEPDIDLEDLPKLLIDTATREGMSGSPVILQYNGILLKDGQITDDTIIGMRRKFLGIYSARLGDDTFQAQLGVVWKERVIEEIIKGKKFGISSSKLAETINS